MARAERAVREIMFFCSHMVLALLEQPEYTKHDDQAIQIVFANLYQLTKDIEVLASHRLALKLSYKTTV